MFKDFNKVGASVEKTLAPIAAPKPAPKPASAASRPPEDDGVKAHLELKGRLHQLLLDRLNLSMIEKVETSELRREIAAVIPQFLAEENRPLRSDQVKQLVDELMDEVMGLGPLEPLIEDGTVNDILVNSYDKVYIERFGVLEKTNVRFRDERHLLRVIDKIVSRIGRRVDESQPWVDARLEDGSRVNAIIRPCAIDGPSVSIRKFSSNKLSFERLVENGALNRQAARFLAGVVEARLNVLISGGTGSGKTTMLNAMSSFIDPRQRIVTIEDAAELQLQQDHVVRLETRPANTEGTGAVTQRDLVRNALRMRPDRIIVGEVRGAEAFDMLQAMNTGHDGSMTTLHANSARDALGRLEQMVTMIGIDFPLSAIRSQIAAGIHVVVQLNRLSDGQRRITSISEITGMEGNIITMQDIFVFKRRGKDADGRVLGSFEATGIRPANAEALMAAGVDISPDTFAAGVGGE